MPIRVRNLPSDRQAISREPAARPDTDWFGYWQDLGRGIRELQAGPVATSYTVTTLPTTATAGAIIYVSNESGGAVPAFWDGTNWRRMTDRAIVT